MRITPLALTMFCMFAISRQALAQAPATDTPPELAGPPKWEEAAEGRGQNLESAKSQSKVFRLTQVKSAEAERIISQLFRDGLATVAVDARTNSLIVRGAASRLAEIEALLQKLDAAPTITAAENPFGTAPHGTGGGGTDPFGMPDGGMHPGGMSAYPSVASGRNTEKNKRTDAKAGIGAEQGPSLPGPENASVGRMGSVRGGGPEFGGSSRMSAMGVGGVSTSQVLEMTRQSYQGLESRCQEIARQLRAREAQSKNQPQADADKLRGELLAAVKDAFRARQQLHRAELADFYQRMLQIRRSVEMRDRVADQIVRRRVEDLLNPNLQWDVAPTASPFAPQVEAGIADGQ